MKEEKLYIAWQDPWSRRWWPVGLLARDKYNIFRFSYTKGAQTLNEREHLELFANMNDLFTIYQSDELFPLFSNRLLPRGRPEYKKYLEWMDIKDDVDNASFTMLALTEGVRGTDTLEVFRCPEKNKQGKYDVRFFIHGIRYLAGPDMERINELKEKEKLFLMLDFQNEFDYWAIALRTEDPLSIVGYCPRYFTEDIYKLLASCEPSDIVVTVHRVNTDAPQQYKLLCRVVAPWPDGFQPCSGEEYKPIGNIRKKRVNVIRERNTFGHFKEHKEAASKLSRGTADFIASHSSGRAWKVEIKTIRGDYAASHSRKNLGNLKQSVSRTGAALNAAKDPHKGTKSTSARARKKI